MEKCGDAYSLNLPFRLTALRVIMGHANDWFDSWQNECHKTPDASNAEAYQKLCRKCEDWACKERLDADSNAVNQDIGGVDDGGGGEQDDEAYYDECGNWRDDVGNHWPADFDDAGDTNEISKGKGKGAGPQCYQCGGWGHIGRNCPSKGAVNGTGGGKGGNAPVDFRGRAGR